MISSEVLIATDLDRTLLPNGREPESPEARDRFRSVAERSETSIAYVSGRHLELALEGVATYDLPRPDFFVGDVGTSIYTFERGEWQLDGEWHVEIGKSWGDRSCTDLEKLVSDFDDLRLQPPEKQGKFKLSYYTPLDVEVSPLLARLERRLTKEEVRVGLIWSRDEIARTGLLDVLPDRATKRHAVEFLIEKWGFRLESTLFAGDSGNDLPVVASNIPCVFVANASEDVREEAMRLAAVNGTSESLYLARGGLLGMNGNYSAGILEGLVHFFPQAADWFR